MGTERVLSARVVFNSLLILLALKVRDICPSLPVMLVDGCNRIAIRRWSGTESRINRYKLKDFFQLEGPVTYSLSSL